MSKTRSQLWLMTHTSHMTDPKANTDVLTADPKALLQPGPNQATSHTQDRGLAISGYMSARGIWPICPQIAPMVLLFVGGKAVRDNVLAYNPQ